MIISVFMRNHLELVNVPKTDSATLAMFIKDCLVRFCLPIGQCRGAGIWWCCKCISGVAALIQQDEPSAIHVHCLAHCTNLCLQAVGRQVAPVRDALDLVAEVSQLIRFSPKRSSLFQSMQSQLSYNSPSLKPLCHTRWTVRTAAINSGVKDEACAKPLHCMQDTSCFHHLYSSLPSLFIWHKVSQRTS